MTLLLTIASVGLVVAVLALLLVLVWIVGIERRVTVIEGKLNHLPTHGDLQRINNGLAAVASDVAALREQSEGTARNVAMIHQHLLDGDR